jgi:hypothetical protein
MKSIRHAHVIVVANSDHGLVLAARLRRMDVARVTAAAGLAEARGLCQEGGADACIVLMDDAVPDGLPAPIDAPGRNCGVPSLLIVQAITPFVRRSARRGGYLAAVPAGVPPRMLYRRLGAALQKRRAVRRVRTPMPAAMGLPGLMPERAFAFGKPTLH